MTNTLEIQFNPTQSAIETADSFLADDDDEAQEVYDQVIELLNGRYTHGAITFGLLTVICRYIDEADAATRCQLYEAFMLMLYGACESGTNTEVIDRRRDT